MERMACWLGTVSEIPIALPKTKKTHFTVHVPALSPQSHTTLWNWLRSLSNQPFHGWKGTHRCMKGYTHEKVAYNAKATRSTTQINPSSTVARLSSASSQEKRCGCYRAVTKLLLADSVQASRRSPSPFTAPQWPFHSRQVFMTMNCTETMHVYCGAAQRSLLLLGDRLIH
jgi:hypothetical protein